jgi:GntR family transcriptional regulator, transcriptional repressor for pyruvate dehydrogenase complex
MTQRPDWQTVRKVRLHEQVIQQIEIRIRNEDLQVGDRLPGERELSQLLGVGRPAIREALRVLEAMGIVEARAGTGEDSGSVIVGRPDEALASLLRFHIGIRGFTMRDVVETRIMVEGWAVEQVALRASEGELLGVQAIIDAMADPTLDFVDFNRLDTDFHVSLAKLTRNSLVAHWMQAIRDAIQQEMTTKFEALSDWHAVAEGLRDEHAQILAAVSKGDGELAAELVATHIQGFYFGVD